METNPKEKFFIGEELDVVLDKLTQDNQVDSFEEYFAEGDRVRRERREKAEREKAEREKQAAEEAKRAMKRRGGKKGGRG